MNAARQWTQDDIDADMADDAPDVCHHGVGFDEDCDWCEFEIAAEAVEERHMKRQKKQPDLFAGSDSSASEMQSG